MLNIYSPSKIIGLLLGPILFMTILLSPNPEAITISGWHYIASTMFIVTWLIFEPVPIGITSMLPIILYPVTGVMESGEVLKSFANPYIFLFIGGYFIAIALEKHEVHKYIACRILNKIGNKPSRIILAMMVTTYFFSMWMTNTAATMMMLPLSLAIIRSIDKYNHASNDSKDKTLMFAALIICIPYSATIGGMATLVGSPPNMVVASFMHNIFSVDVTFSGWLYFGIPLSLGLLFISYIIITKIIFKTRLQIEYNRDLIDVINKDMSLSKPQVFSLFIFAMTAVLWFLRPMLAMNFEHMQITDEMISIFAAVLLFVLPISIVKGKFLLGKEDMAKVQWPTLMMFGCGMVMSYGLSNTGLLEIIGKYVSLEKEMSELTFIIIVIFSMAIITEFINNTSLTLAIIPLTSAIALTLGFNPLIVGLISSFAISMSFMLPVATPPNSLAYIEGYIETRDFIRAGFLIKICGIVLILVMYHFKFFDIYKVDFELVKKSDMTYIEYPAN